MRDAEMYLRNARGDTPSSPNALHSGPDGSFTLYAVAVPTPTQVRVMAWHDDVVTYGEWFTIRPMQIVTGVIVTLPAPTPTPTPSETSAGGPCSEDCGGGGLPATGLRATAPIAGFGLLPLLAGAVLLRVARRAEPPV